MSAGIWIYDRDDRGYPTRVRIYVKPCSNEPDPEARDERGVMHAWQHGLAEVVRDDGATLLCRMCGKTRAEEEARESRMNRLPTPYRLWLESRGITDWHPANARRSGHER